MSFGDALWLARRGGADAGRAYPDRGWCSEQVV
jgi:hypothetical protein